MSKARFTAWLSESEREGIRRLAIELDTSENYVVRMMIRQALGLAEPVLPLLHVTSVTASESK